MDVEGETVLGSVYVRHEGGMDERIFGPLAGEFFGSSLAYQGDRLIVGASEAEGYQPYTGVVYTFDYDEINGWTGVNRLAHTDSTSWGSFGSAVAVDGDRLLVGAPGQAGGGVSAVWPRTRVRSGAESARGAARATRAASAQAAESRSAQERRVRSCR